MGYIQIKILLLKLMVYYCCLRHTEKYENYKYESKKIPKVAHLNLMSLYFETLFKRETPKIRTCILSKFISFLFHVNV